ncbi:MAG: fucose isomerase [Epulopiscium sp.]|nr:fucose isomerase [Candidatus Epulonipiscium sp.]
MKKSTFGVIVTTRGFFNPLLAREGRKELLGKLKEMGYKCISLTEEDTPYGAIETIEDAEKCADLFVNHRKEIDGIIVSLPNFGDEVAVVTALDRANLNVPVLIHAFDDDLNKMDLDHRRDAFCGKLSVCNNLYEYGIKFSNTTLHTCGIDSKEFADDIEYFDGVCRVVSGLKNVRIAQIGVRPAPFQTVRYSEKLLQKSGIQIVPIDLSEIMAAAKAMEVNKAVENKVKEIKAYGNIPEDIPSENIIKSAKLTLAVEDAMKKNNCAAGTMQCWSSLEENYGCAACLPMSMLGEKGIPFACETDVTSAVAMYALYLASSNPSGCLDWNNNYENDRNKCIGIHCSNYPKSFISNEFEISNLDVLGKSLGEDKCFGACKAKIASGPMTYAKVSTDDQNGRIRAYIGEGKFTDDPAATAGGVAICEVEDLQGLMNYICMNGFEHHVAMNRTHTAKILEEAFGKYLGWSVYRHKDA